MLKLLKCLNVLGVTVMFLFNVFHSEVNCATPFIGPNMISEILTKPLPLRSARSSNFTEICCDLRTAFPNRAACKECCLMSPAVSLT